MDIQPLQEISFASSLLRNASQVSHSQPCITLSRKQSPSRYHTITVMFIIQFALKMNASCVQFPVANTSKLHFNEYKLIYYTIYHNAITRLLVISFGSLASPSSDLYNVKSLATTIQKPCTLTWEEYLVLIKNMS